MLWSFGQSVDLIKTWSERIPTLFIAVCKFDAGEFNAAGFMDEFLVFDTGEVGFRFVWDGGVFLFRFDDKATFNFAEPGEAPDSLNVPEGHSLVSSLEISLSGSETTCVICEPWSKQEESQSVQ